MVIENEIAHGLFHDRGSRIDSQGELLGGYSTKRRKLGRW